MVVYVRPSQLKGRITVPPSKSQSHRAILFGAMGKGTTTIRNLLHSPDTEGMIRSWKKLGAAIDVQPTQVAIQGLGGKIQRTDQEIDVGNSGISLRFLTGLAALSSNPITITGDHSIQNIRPMHPTMDALRQLGVKMTAHQKKGYAPLTVQGPLLGGTATIDGKDSQHVSALLIAAMFAQNPTTLHVKNQGELPWVELTLHWLDRLGVVYTRHDYTSYRVEGNHLYDGFTYSVPGDLSSAAFPLAAAVITNSELLLENIDMTDPQGDKRIIPILQEMGADISVDSAEKTVRIGKKSKLHGITVNINDCIDTITILATVACFAEGRTQITHARNAKNKECDRITCIAKELNKMGGRVTRTSDGLIIHGSSLKGTTVHSHADHRMAMSLAVAGMGAKGETIITESACIAKTYPTFVEDFRKCGARMT